MCDLPPDFWWYTALILFCCCCWLLAWPQKPHWTGWTPTNDEKRIVASHSLDGFNNTVELSDVTKRAKSGVVPLLLPTHTKRHDDDDDGGSRPCNGREREASAISQRYIEGEHERHTDTEGHAREPKRRRRGSSSSVTTVRLFSALAHKRNGSRALSLTERSKNNTAQR